MSDTVPPVEGKDYEVLSDGETIWVNDHTGTCIGRFSKHGIDIHAGYERQIKGEHCLQCTHEKPDAYDFREFVLGMRQHHGVNVDLKHRPKWLGPDLRSESGVMKFAGDWGGYFIRGDDVMRLLMDWRHIKAALLSEDPVSEEARRPASMNGFAVGHMDHFMTEMSRCLGSDLAVKDNMKPFEKCTLFPEGDTNEG